MNEKRFGMTFVRKCKIEQEKLIKDYFCEIESLFNQNPNPQISWVNIYKNGQFCLKNEEKWLELKQWIQKLVLQSQDGVFHYIVSFGFIKNPKGNNKWQNFHYDYDLCYKNLFIPMTYLVTENSTQFSSQSLICQTLPKAQSYASNDRELLQKEGVDFMVLSQVIAKPYVILKLEAGTVHRGIRNSSNEDRIMLFIGYAPKKLTIHENIVQEFQQHLPSSD